ncbi:MAG: flagellin FliC [Magnetococcales bacterium]|nr:flagellin FliC [Magnetococcales bacterium]
MALTINSSIASLNTQRQLMSSTSALNQTFARLSSGLRINGSKDDSAGMAISSRMTAQIRGMGAAIRNSNDGVSLAQVAEGALGETVNALQRMRELYVQAANSTYSSADRNTLQNEIIEMKNEIARIASSTSFNGVKLLDGTYSGQKFQVGAGSGQQISMTIQGVSLSAFAINITSASAPTTTVGGYMASIGLNVSGAIAVSNATRNLTNIDNALDSVSDIRASLGAVQGRFESIIANLSNVIENTTAARSRIMDADIAVETANLTRNSILQQAGVAILAQANQQPAISLQLLGTTK